MTDDAAVLVRLPDPHREAFRAPLGAIFTDSTSLLAEAGEPLLTIGDVTTNYILQAGTTPDVAVIDGRTQRSAVDSAIEQRLAQTDTKRLQAENPPGTITASLVEAIRTGMTDTEPVQIEVDGEEDLGVIPAILLAPIGASVVYGQPKEGMVHVPVTADSNTRARELLGLMEGDQERITALLAT